MSKNNRRRSEKHLKRKGSMATLSENNRIKDPWKAYLNDLRTKNIFI